MTVRSFQSLTPCIDPSAYVDDAALVLGDVTMDAHSSIWPMAVARGDVQSIRIGLRSNVQDGAVLHVTHDGPYTPGGQPLLIGADVVIGHRAVLHGCTVQDRCLIGMGAIVMDAVVLESGLMLAAGTLVPPGRHLQGGWLYRGSPAQQARPLNERERAFLEYSPAQYVRLKERHVGGEKVPGQC